MKEILHSGPYQFKQERTQLLLCWISSFQHRKEVNLAQVSRGLLCTVTGAFLTMAHWISHTVAEIWPAQRHARPHPTSWTHFKNPDQAEIRSMFNSSREINGNGELWPKGISNCHSFGQRLLPIIRAETRKRRIILGSLVSEYHSWGQSGANHTLEAAVNLWTLFRKGCCSHIVPSGPVALCSALCIKHKASFLTYVCIRITQTHRQFSIQNWNNTSGKDAEAGKQANTSSNPCPYCSASQSLVHTGLLSNPLYTPSVVECRERAVLLDPGWLEM